MLPALERHHDVLALTLAGHAGGPPLERAVDDAGLADAVERAMDEAGFATAHLVGNSLGGYVALQLAARGRARTVVALAPAGGWAPGDESYRELLSLQRELVAALKATAPHAHALLATPEGRRRATSLTTERYEHIPADLLAHQALAMAICPGAAELIDHALRAGWRLDAERITWPRARRVGHRRPPAAMARRRRAIPARLAAARRLGRARGRRPRPAARRPARDRRAHPRLRW